MTEIVEAGTHSEIREKVRVQLSWKLEQLMKDLNPYINGDTGEILPGHVNVFLTAVKIQGGLWNVFDKPDSDALTPARVQKMLEEARIEAAEAAVAADRALQAAERTLALESAHSKVRDRLEELRSPGAQAS